MKTKLVAPLAPVLLVALGLLLAPLASAASAPLTSDGSVHACVKAKGKASQRGMLRVVGPNRKCNTKRGWKALNWSVTGPAGDNGAQGPAGPKGAAGTNGSNGSNGAAGEKGSDATVESQLKEVIASQTKEIEKLTDEVSTLTGGLLNLTSTVNGVEGTLDSTVTSLSTLTGKVTGQCSLLNEVSSQANGITSGINQLTGGLTTLLPLLSPITLPSDTTGATC
jgi:Collagen triple helix repeat (20 copies)